MWRSQQIFLGIDWTLILTQRSPSKVERWPSNEIECSIDGHITTNIPFACYQLYGHNLQTKSSLSRCLEVMSTSKRNVKPHGQTSMPRDSVVTSMSAHHLLPSVMKLLPSVTEPTCSRGDSSCISNIINPTAVSIPYLWNYTPSGSSQRYQDLGDGGVYCWRCPGGTGMKPTVNRLWFLQ